MNTPDIGIDILWVSPADLHPNLYNYNVVDPDLYAKAVESIKTYGFIDPVTVRTVDDQYVIIDGEHRVKIAKQLGLRLVPVIILDVDDDTAQQLSIVLNELKGRPDPAKLQRILRGLSERHSIDDLLRTLPVSRDQFTSLTEVKPGQFTAPPAPDAARWVERMYRLPRAAADILDQALAEAKEYEEVSEDWKALEAIAKRYIE